MKKNHKKLLFVPRTAQLDPSCFVQGDVILGESTQVKKNSVINTQQNTIIIGSDVQINEEVKITSYGPEGYTFICNNVEIGRGTQVCNATLEDNVRIEDKAVIMDKCYIAKGAVIGAHTIVTPHSRVDENQICEPNSVYSGNPAVKIATLDTSSQNILKAFKSPLFSQVV